MVPSQLDEPASRFQIVAEPRVSRINRIFSRFHSGTSSRACRRRSPRWRRSRGRRWLPRGGPGPGQPGERRMGDSQGKLESRYLGREDLGHRACDSNAKIRGGGRDQCGAMESSFRASRPAAHTGSLPPGAVRYIVGTRNLQPPIVHNQRPNTLVNPFLNAIGERSCLPLCQVDLRGRPRSSSNIASILAAKSRPTTTTSTSSLWRRLHESRLLVPTVDQRPSMTAVLACKMASVPRSYTFTPDSNSAA